MQKTLLSALLLAVLCACNKDEEQPTPPENNTLITYSADPGFRDSLREEIFTNYKRHMRLEGLRFAALQRWGKLEAVLTHLGFKPKN
jgi:hypothetical protein